MSITATIITTAGVIVVAIIEALATVQRTRNERHAKEREEKRAKHDALQMELSIAQMEVSRAQSEACTLLLKHAHGEHLNGNVEACITRIQAAEAAQDKIRDRIVAA